MPEARATAGATRALPDQKIDDLGQALFDAERAATVIEPLTNRHPGITVADAYAIQQTYAKLRVGAGARIVGQKVGATSKAIQDLFDIDTPDYGHLFDDMECSQTEPISISKLIQPLVEPEIAFVLSDDLNGPGIERGDIIDASRGVVACLEVIDSRIDDWRIRLADTIADNGSSARFVIGSDVVSTDGLDLIAEQVVFRRNGEVVGEGTGAEVLGDPAAAAAWLINALGDFGQSLSAGSFVLSGSITSAVPARPGDRFIASFDTIGEVSCSFDST